MKWRVSSFINDEQTEFSIDFKHFQRIFIPASFHSSVTDGQTDRTSYRGAMAHLGIILAYFWIISSDFCFFSRFSTRAWQTNQATDQPTDRASYRGAMAHLKTKRESLFRMGQWIKETRNLEVMLNRRRKDRICTYCNGIDAHLPRIADAPILQ